MKPDVVAPGEKIISCLSSGGAPASPGLAGSIGAARAVSKELAAYYKEDSGTSMAAAHVSGAIAAFLSVAREFIGRSEEVKEIFTSNATDLNRLPTFQGRGLVDLFRALSYVRGNPGRTNAAPDVALAWESKEETALRAVGGTSMPENGSNAIKMFISYSHKDERLRKQLQAHLDLLRRRGVIDVWHDRRIGAGQEWVGAIDEHLNSARIILLLVSADFLASDYCYDTEMTRALERDKAGEAKVIPVILRYVGNWREFAPFAHLKALPTDGKPVEAWSPPARAYADIADGIRIAVEELHSATSHARRNRGAARIDATR